MVSTEIKRISDLSSDINRIHALTAGPPCVEVIDVSFDLPCSALSALKTFDQRFDMKTTEVQTEGQTFMVWRMLKIGGMELRFRFLNPNDLPHWNYVQVFGFKTEKEGAHSSFKGPCADKCFSLFLSKIAPRNYIYYEAVAMGQHARLGSESLMFTLPDDILRLVLQPKPEHWDSDKEDALRAEIKLRAFEPTKEHIDKLIASNVCDDTKEGIFFEGNFNCSPYNMHEMCAKLDGRFGVSTGEDSSDNIFFAKRMLTINDKVVFFTFEYDKFDGPTYIEVQGLGKVEGASASIFDQEAYDYFLDALLRGEPVASLKVTTYSDWEEDE